MTRTELEHIIRAVAAITNEEDLIDPKTMEQRLKQTPMSDGVRRRVETRMRQDQARHGPGRPPE